MDRRTVTVGLLAAFATPAIAQASGAAPIPVQPRGTAESQPNQNLSGNQSATGQNAGAQANAGGARSQGDAQHVEQTLAIGTLAHQAATFAREKAQHPRVKVFAMFEEAEQTTMAEVIKSLADPATTASAPAQGAASTAPVMPQQTEPKMEAMSKLPAGAEFDKAFVALQLEGHQNLLQIQERYISANPANRAQLAIAKLSRTQIKEHIAMLQDIQKELR
jgi:predicted outer membrane protein